MPGKSQPYRVTAETLLSQFHEVSVNQTPYYLSTDDASAYKVTPCDQAQNCLVHGKRGGLTNSNPCPSCFTLEKITDAALLRKISHHFGEQQAAALQQKHLEAAKNLPLHRLSTAHISRTAALTGDVLASMARSPADFRYQDQPRAPADEDNSGYESIRD